MLCDVFAHFLATTDEAPAEVKMGAKTAVTVARRYFLQPSFTATAADLMSAASIERSRRFLFLPDTLVWFEWRQDGVSRGLMLDAADIEAGPLNRAVGYRVHGGPGRFAEGVAFDATAPARQMLTPHPVALPAQHADYEALSLWFGAALALLNTPRLLESRHCETARRNRRRAGKPALLSYTEVHVNIDRLRQSIPGGDGDGMPLHRVRAYPRIARGRVEIVSPCWRGNPKNGVKLHRYIVKREEDNGLDAASLVKPPCTPERRLVGPALPPEIADDPSIAAHLGRLEARSG